MNAPKAQAYLIKAHFPAGDKFIETRYFRHFPKGLASKLHTKFKAINPAITGVSVELDENAPPREEGRLTEVDVESGETW
jgi:hypothetical protein